jgi:conjugative transfer signal peptidase TraF
LSRPILVTGMVAVVALATAVPPRTPCLVWNASTSVPIGLYRVDVTAPKRGDLALVRLPLTIASMANERRYLPSSAYLLKPVAAVGGDRVCRFGRGIFVRGRHSGTANVHDTHGRILPTWRGCTQLAAGDIFLLGPTRDSFDSRYFGVVAGDDVVGRALPVWTFK